MIHVPTPIKYDKTIHFGDRVTKPLDPKNDLEFIRKVLSDLEKDHAETYLVRNERGKVIIIPGFDGKFNFVLKRLFPRLVDFIMSRDITKSQDGKS